MLTGMADGAGVLPPWTEWWPEEQVATLFPDAASRAAVSAEQHRLPLSYFTATLQVPDGWAARPAAYLRFSEAYHDQAAEAAALGWPVTTLEGNHLHPLWAPDAVAEAVATLLERQVGAARIGGPHARGRVPRPLGDNDPVRAEPVWRATAAHADVVGRLLFDFNTEFETPGPTAEEFSARLAWVLERDDVVALLAGEERDPVGLALLTLRITHYFDGPLAQLEELYVRPALRDQGIGTALLTAAIELARERGSGEMHINVDEVDTDTRRFYERHGFVNVEPGADYRMLFYLRDLTPETGQPA
jgi:GNAT superfamily N-acetyltransferase